MGEAGLLSGAGQRTQVCCVFLGRRGQQKGSTGRRGVFFLFVTAVAFHPYIMWRKGHALLRLAPGHLLRQWRLNSSWRRGSGKGVIRSGRMHSGVWGLCTVVGC